MAGASLLTLIDDIATLLDDVAILTKTATQKTAGVLGDDLALNAEQVTGIAAKRELPVVWAVAKGSAKNKLFLVPGALAISAVAPWAVVPLLMLGGAFLAYEGFEKVVHKLLQGAEDEEHRKQHLQAVADPKVDLVALEKRRIKGAIRTDIILSAEIIVITLGTVAEEPFMKRLLVLVVIAALMTVGVYGFVAAIVKLDDVGAALAERTGFVKTLGRGMVRAAPYLMKTLSVAGTIAMFLVGGGILAHGIPPIHHLAESLGTGSVGWLWPTLINGVTGVVAGGILVGVVTLIQKMRKGSSEQASAPSDP